MTRYLYRHKKRGTVYQVITDTASVQCSAMPEIEDVFGDEDWTIYRNMYTGAWYVRPTAEFLDGRFEAIAHSEAASTAPLHHEDI